MKPDSRKNQKLRRQYPFIEKILALPHKPRKEIGLSTHIDNLTIKVQKADEYLLYRSGHAAGINDPSCYIGGLDSARDGQAMKRAEYLYTFNAFGMNLTRNYWIDRDDRHFAHQVFWATHKGDGWMSDPVHDQVEYLVWVTVDMWYYHTQDHQAPFGAELDRSVAITIYQKPKDGFEKLDQRKRMSQHLRVTTNLLMHEAAIKSSREFIVLQGRIDEIGQLLEDEAYRKGMGRYHESLKSWATGKFGSVEVTLAYQAGRDIVQLENKVALMSLGAHSYERLNVMGIDGTLPQLRALVKEVIEVWNRDGIAAFKKPATAEV